MIYFMKYFIIISIFGTLLHILARFFFLMHSCIIKRRRSFVSPSVHTDAQTKRPTASKFGSEILKRVFEESLKIFFHKSIHFFFKYFSKNFFPKFCTRIFFYYMTSFEQMIPYLSIFLLFKWSPFHIGTFLSFVVMLQFKVCLSVWIFVWAINHLKIYQF